MLPTPGERLFQIVPGQRPTEPLLGDDPCDIPFGGGRTDKVAVSLTTDSAHAGHGIPVLRLHAGHRMDLAAFEQTPAMHANLAPEHIESMIMAIKPMGAI